ncbi:hypothetical protein P8C59_005364 [Phyllachora maydis]|uniref:5'-3' exoribonuclease n=1 Tax=Phyllachora maydis TaxID=1825666 RepID=A0AAD9I4P1_9PEZI|nr:hypothetical protein P8C59_005364 [Phyllachora maydis]
MIAVDGVAPRAKMNQQRSRRFRAAQDAKDKEEDKQKFIELLKQQQNKGKGKVKEESYETVAKKAFDSNSITPGTPFMDILAKSIRYWCSYKLNVDPAWAKLKVIISDATVPGEGEHKIMEFVRSQHVFFQQGNPRLCKLCGQNGHDERNCKGEAKKEDNEVSLASKPFIWLHVAILREYLAVELEVPGLPFRFDLERAIDDWVFLCFFVGNDFLPHLPALEIRENGINTLMAIWKDNLAHMGGYVTKDGEVMSGRAIDQINVANQSAAAVLKSQIQDLYAQPSEDRLQGKHSNGSTETAVSALGKRKASIVEEESSQPSTESGKGSDTPAAPSGIEEEGPVDTVKLWEEGYADRYYEQKFHVNPKDFAFRHKVGRAYAEGLAWVLKYYFQGCPSWEWYYPYHYAPFAADFVDIATMQLNFQKGRISRPFEQLMSVLPAASRHAIPEVFHDLMTNEESDIIDFYPEDFVVDLNGKKMAWQGIALLPFIDMPRLLTAMSEKTPLLSAEDEARNRVGKDVLLLSDAHPTLYDEVTSRFYSKKRTVTRFVLNPRTSDGLAGEVEKIEGYHPHGSLVYPLSRNTMPDVDYDRSLSVHYAFPESSVHVSRLRELHVDQ